MARSRTALGTRLLLGRPRRLETRLVAPRSRKARSSRKTCRRFRLNSEHASATRMRLASRPRRTSSLANSLLLIDTTAIRPVLPQPNPAGECHLNFAEGCHLYIAPTHQIRVRSVLTRILDRSIERVRCTVSTGLLPASRLDHHVSSRYQSTWLANQSEGSPVTSFICTTCGTSYAPAEAPPAHC